MINTLQQFPGRVLIDSVTHVTDTTTVEITELVSEINIHSSMNIDSTFAELLVIDHINYYTKSKLIAGDGVVIKISHNNEPTTYKFKIRSITDMNNVESGNTYNIKLVSELAYNSYFRKVSQSYTGTPSDIAGLIFADNTEEKFGIWETSVGNQSVVIPMWSPMYTIEWLANRSRSASSPARFIFFQDSKLKYNFLSLPKLKELYKEAPLTYRYNNNKFGEDKGAGINPNSEAEMLAIKKIDYLNNYDIKNAVERGVIQNTLIRTDFTKKVVDIQSNNYWDTYKDRNLNTGDQWKFEATTPGRIVLENVATSISNLPGLNKISDETTANPYMDRSQEIEITVLGNNVVDIGQVVKIEIPTKEPENTQKTNDLDVRWSGNYYITAKRDIITRRGHNMILRCTKESQSTKDYT